MINSEEKFEKMFDELLDEIENYPNRLQKQGAGLKKCSVKRPNQTKKELCSLQESIGNMRICIKYLLFDLDATRRESVYFKKLLEDKET